VDLNFDIPVFATVMIIVFINEVLGVIFSHDS